MWCAPFQFWFWNLRKDERKKFLRCNGDGRDSSLTKRFRLWNFKICELIITFFHEKIEFLYQSVVLDLLVYLLFVIMIELGKNRENLGVVLWECGMNVNCEVGKSNFYFQTTGAYLIVIWWQNFEKKIFIRFWVQIL